jgi:hypothetical protein
MSRARFETPSSVWSGEPLRSRPGSCTSGGGRTNPMRRLSRGVRSPLATSPSHIPRALATRLARLEHAIIPPRQGYLQVFRYRQETEAEALSRYGVDAAEWPRVHIRHGWGAVSRLPRGGFPPRGSHKTPPTLNSGRGRPMSGLCGCGGGRR